MVMNTSDQIKDRIAALNWSEIALSLDNFGYAKTSAILSEAECNEVISFYNQPERFRSRVEMAKFQFGAGEYQYFADPLPPVVNELRTSFYSPLASIANRWMEAMESDERYPETLEIYLQQCRRKGASRNRRRCCCFIKKADTTVCIRICTASCHFRYRSAFVLSRRDIDYKGGEFLLLEQRPRAQSRGEAINIEQGEMLIFPNQHRPVKGTRGFYRVTMRHGVSCVLSGERYCLGVIFHNAK